MTADGRQLELEYRVGVDTRRTAEWVCSGWKWMGRYSWLTHTISLLDPSYTPAVVELYSGWDRFSEGWVEYGGNRGGQDTGKSLWRAVRRPLFRRQTDDILKRFFYLNVGKCSSWFSFSAVKSILNNEDSAFYTIYVPGVIVNIFIACVMVGRAHN
jgi:hypothetical protein